jgi:flagellar motor protein MotB
MADMNARGVRRSRSTEEEESYFISMADMMVGLLFIFIILLLYFALQFQQKTKAISDAGETRTEILRRLQDDLAAKGLRVTIDTRTGVLRLPAAILFAKDDYRLSVEGQTAIGTLARSLSTVLPCYSYAAGGRHLGCPQTIHAVDAIFIEGHTDADPLHGYGSITDNMDLSALRATNTFRALVSAAPALNQLRNLPAGDPAASPILSVSGYGADRPIPGSGSDAAAKAANRRIDLRFLMESPRADAKAAGP